MRYLIVMLAATALLISQAAFAPGQALAGRNDGFQNRVVQVDHRGHRRDQGDWGRRGHYRGHRRDRWDRDYYRYDRYRYRHHPRPRYRDRDDWQGFFFFGPPLPIPLPPIPLPPLPHRW